jgi:hypothetical protein
VAIPPKPGVVFRIIWRSFSELFGAMLGPVGCKRELQMQLIRQSASVPYSAKSLGIIQNNIK